MMELPLLFQFFELLPPHTQDSVAMLVFIALIVCAVITGCHNPPQATRGMKVLRIILNSSAGLLVLLCLLNTISVVGLVYGHNAPGSSLRYGVMSQAVIALLIQQFFWHSLAIAFVSIFVLVPSTRIHSDTTCTATLCLVSLSLTMTVIAYWFLSWWPGADFHFYLRNLVPLLACAVSAAVWFGFKVGVAFVQKRDARAWPIVGLVVFHLVCVCIHTILGCVAVARIAAAEMSQ